MNNKAHLRPKDFDSNGDIIPIAWKEEKGDLISRSALIDTFSNTVFFDEDNKCKALELIDNAPTVEYPFYQEAYQTGYEEGKNERQKGKSVIKCQDCKYRVKAWREDRRMKEKGYWVYGCEHFGEIMGYWGFGGNDDEFCSDAELKGGADNG